MKKQLLLVGLLLSLVGNIFASPLIKGKVTDASSGEALAGATIYVPGTINGTYSDALGAFVLESDIAINTIRVTFLGYESQDISIADPDQELKINLKPTGLELESVKLNGSSVANLTNLSRLDVNLRPINSSQDVLRMVPGLFIAQHGGGGKAEQIFLRGFDIDHGTDISISVDGMPVNMVSHAHGQGYADLHFLIPELINTVDFGKGPYHADHGNFATAGYVDFQTKNVLEKSMVKAEYGMYNTLRTVGMVNLLGKKLRTKGQNAYLASELFLSDGPFQAKQNFLRYNIFGKYNGLVGENTLATFEFSHFKSRWDQSGQIPLRAIQSGMIDYFGSIDPTEGGITGRTNVTGKVVSGLDNGGTLENQFYYSRYDFELYSNFTFFLLDSINGDQIRQKEKRNIFGYNGAYKFENKVGTSLLKSRVGIGFRHDDVQDNELSHTANRTTTLSRMSLGNVNETNAWVFVDEQLEYRRWMFNVGARLDYFKNGYVDALDTAYSTQSAQTPFVSPKVNIVFTPSEKAQLYLKSGIGFHSNDTRVVVAQGGKDILPPAYGVDLGANLKPVPRLFINAALWYLHLDQEFVYVGDAGIVEPSGKTRRIGGDLSIRYQLLDWLFFDVDVNYTHARSLESERGEDYIPLAPVMTSIGGISVKHKSGVNGSVRYRYLLDRPANEDNSILAEGYGLLDANIYYTHRKFEVGISVENVLNSKWREAQFETETRLPDETAPVSEIHFTPGTPFALRGKVSYFF